MLLEIAFLYQICVTYSLYLYIYFYVLLLINLENIKQSINKITIQKITTYEWKISSIKNTLTCIALNHFLIHILDLLAHLCLPIKLLIKIFNNQPTVALNPLRIFCKGIWFLIIVHYILNNSLDIYVQIVFNCYALNALGTISLSINRATRSPIYKH